MDCARRDAGLDDSRWFTPIGSWHPTIPRVRPGELAPQAGAWHAESVAEPPAFAILRPAQAYDLATPGTPLGILAVARAADVGGVWRYSARFALAVAAAPKAGDGVLASLALRLNADTPDRTRRAWVVYLRRADPETGRSSWSAGSDGGAALLDTADAARPVRAIGVEELKATLRGEPWAPPPARVVYTVPCPTCKAPARLTGDGRIYSNHKCDPKHVEGRS
jgi:hypothetical protein